MSALDAEFLHLEDGVNHLHIGACAVFEGPAPGDAEGFDLLASALDRIPRYRQRARQVPLQLGRPVWEDDPDFHLENHVFRTVLEAPAGDAELQELMAGVMSTELDRRHPLWEIWFVDGLADGRWAMLAKVHHCMVDGVAGVELMQAVLDVSPDAERPPSDTAWEPTPGPSDTRLVVDSLGQMATGAVDVSRRLAGTLTRPVELLGTLRTVAAGATSWLGEAWPTPRTSVDGAIGPERRWTWVQVPLAAAKDIKTERSGTINDVIMAVVTRGFRDLLLTRGEDPATTEIRTLVPVSVRSEHGRLDNEVSAVVAELPVEIAVPELCYEAVRTEMRWLKLSHEAEAGEVVTSLAELVPAPLLAYGSRAAAAVLRRHPQRSINTVTTNVPGPPFPIYAVGRRMLAYHPYVPVAFGVRFAVAILSYDGNLFFGITGDRESAPDVDVLAKGIEAGFEELRDHRAER